MQNVEVVVAILREERCNQWVGNGFKGSVCQGKYEHAPEEELVSCVSVLTLGSTKGDEGGDKVEKKRCHDKFAIADLIHDNPADHDAKTEAGKTSSADSTQLGAAESKISSPVGKDATSNAKTHTRGKNGYKACPEESFTMYFVVITHML